jgi:hypothetical protein
VDARTELARMTNPLTVPPARFAIAGDWHANTKWARAAIQYAAGHRASILLHTGDFAGDFTRSSFLAAVSEAAIEHRLPILWVDGNHDDHAKLARLPLGPGGLRPIVPHVWHIPRGYRWSWNGIRFLGLGGAHSVDRQLRLACGYPWWPGETLTRRDIQRAIRPGPVDVMICHDSPAGAAIPGLDATGFPLDELVAAARHRDLLRDVVDHVRPVQLWHGHYHVRYTATVHPGTGICRVEGLDCDGTTLAGNVRIVDLDEIADQVHAPHVTEPRLF